MALQCCVCIKDAMSTKKPILLQSAINLYYEICKQHYITVKNYLYSLWHALQDHSFQSVIANTSVKNNIGSDGIWKTY